MVASPFHRSLYEFFQLVEEERITTFVSRLERLADASYIGVAVNAPKHLTEARNSILNSAVPKASANAAKVDGTAIIERMRALDAALAASTANPEVPNVQPDSSG